MEEQITTEESTDTETVESAEDAVIGKEPLTSPEKAATEEAETADEAAEAAEPPSLEEQLEAARAEAVKNLEGWMRAQAEFANARKRLEKERAETYLNATTDLVTRLLPVLDDFDRALAEVPEEIAENGWLEGIVLVHRKLSNILQALNVVPIEAVGQPFDPNYHEAIMQESSDEHESGTVTRELQQGYQLGDRVIRPAIVYVAE